MFLYSIALVYLTYIKSLILICTSCCFFLCEYLSKLTIISSRCIHLNIYFIIYRQSMNLPLSPIADTCRVSRNSLSLIANSKPKTFILTIAKEIKRVNASSNQSAQNANNNFPFTAALTRGKPEILHIIEKLIDNQSQDVFELLSDVSKIIIQL